MTAVLDLLERRWLALTLALAALVTGLSLIPQAQMPGAAQSYDKVEHLIAYSAIALPAAYAAAARLALGPRRDPRLERHDRGPAAPGQPRHSPLRFPGQPPGGGPGVALACALRRLRRA